MSSSAPSSGPASSRLDRTGDVGAGSDRAHAARPSAPLRAGDARGRAVRQSRMAEPRRVGEGSGGGADDPRRRSVGQAASGSDARRCDVGEHRHRLRDDRRGARLQGQAVRAREREPRAEADSSRVRRRSWC